MHGNDCNQTTKPNSSAYHTQIVQSLSYVHNMITTVLHNNTESMNLTTILPNSHLDNFTPKQSTLTKAYHNAEFQ